MSEMGQADVRLNRLAQGKLPLDEEAAWFGSLPEPGKRAVLRRLVFLAAQAGVTPADGAASVAESGLKATVNAAVLIALADGQRTRLAKMTALPERELASSFRLLALAFARADARRREQRCQGHCTHWWHHFDQYPGPEQLSRPEPPTSATASG